MNAPASPTPAEVRQAILAALVAVRNVLPSAAKAGLDVAVSSDELASNEAARVALWESIAGRDQDKTVDVLTTRLVICALHPSEIARDPESMLDYFRYTFRAAGLPQDLLPHLTVLQERLAGV